MSGPLLKVENLTKHYPLGAGIFKKSIPVIRALEDVSFPSRPAKRFASSANPAVASPPSRGS